MTTSIGNVATGDYLVLLFFMMLKLDQYVSDLRTVPNKCLEFNGPIIYYFMSRAT